jgi:hypothetical protein
MRLEATVTAASNNSTGSTCNYHCGLRNHTLTGLHNA